MDDRELDNRPNPFEIFSHPAASRRRSLASAIKFFFGTAFLFCVVTVSQLYWKQSRVSGLLDSFSAKTSTEKIDDLNEFEEAGEAGIEGLVTALADDQPAVHESALELLSDIQMRWLTLPSQDLANRRQRLSDAILKQASQCRDDRSARFLRLKRLAHTVAQQALDSNHDNTPPHIAAINDIVFSRLMHIAAHPASQTRQTIADNSQNNAEIVDANPPLPIERANWTDWPPAANDTNVALYRAHSMTNKTNAVPLPSDNEPVQQAASSGEPQPVDLTPQGPVIAAQFLSTQDTNPTTSSARLVRPTYGIQNHIHNNVQNNEDRSAGRSAVDAWIDRLASPSRFTRLKAVERLSDIGDAQAIIAIRLQLQRETDQVVAFRMREAIETHADSNPKTPAE